MTKIEFKDWLKRARAGDTIEYHVAKPGCHLRFNRKPEDDCECANAALKAAGYEFHPPVHHQDVTRWRKEKPAKVYLTQRRGENGLCYLATKAAAVLALLVLAGCGGLWYEPARDPSHIERCERGEVTDFCR